MQIISLFDRSGVMVEPFVEAGHDVLTIDIGAAKHKFPSIQADIRDVEPQEADIIFAFPPCTHLAVSGTRWWKSKGPAALEEGLHFVDIARSWCKNSKYWLIENPVGRLSTNWRPPNWSFNPNEYAGYLPKKHQQDDQYTKKTCIWSNFAKPKTKPLPAIRGSIINRIPGWGSEACKYQRSLTPKGFAMAVAEHLLSGAVYQPPLFEGVLP